MTDSRLQELKRAWEASGSVEDEAAYLRERVRVGDLTQERLELAAYCGHEGAQIAVTTCVQSAPAEEWLSGLRSHGRKACAAAAAAAAHLGIAQLAHPNSAEAKEVASRAIAIAERYAAGGLELGALVAREVTGEAYLAAEGLPEPASLATLAAAFASKTVYDSDPLGWPGEDFEQACRLHGTERVVAVVRKALIGFSLVNLE
ncbi:MAG: hypothetical protein KC492_18805 [Myxococcales bacterium]|nr:hypothetical protein [Myxococcales bacterium]